MGMHVYIRYFKVKGKKKGLYADKESDGYFLIVSFPCLDFVKHG